MPSDPTRIAKIRAALRAAGVVKPPALTPEPPPGTLDYLQQLAAGIIRGMGDPNLRAQVSGQILEALPRAAEDVGQLYLGRRPEFEQGVERGALSLLGLTPPDAPQSIESGAALAQGAAMGFLDDLGDVPLPLGVTPRQLAPEAVAKYEAVTKPYLQRAVEQHPASELFGGFAVPVPAIGPSKGAFGVAARTSVNVGQGALSGFGYGEGGLKERGKSALIGGVLAVPFAAGMEGAQGIFARLARKTHTQAIADIGGGPAERIIQALEAEPPAPWTPAERINWNKVPSRIDATELAGLTPEQQYHYLEIRSKAIRDQMYADIANAPPKRTAPDDIEVLVEPSRSEAKPPPPVPDDPLPSRWDDDTDLTVVTDVRAMLARTDVKPLTATPDPLRDFQKTASLLVPALAETRPDLHLQQLIERGPGARGLSPGWYKEMALEFVRAKGTLPTEADLTNLFGMLSESAKKFARYAQAHSERLVIAGKETWRPKTKYLQVEKQPIGFREARAIAAKTRAVVNADARTLVVPDHPFAGFEGISPSEASALSVRPRGGATLPADVPIGYEARRAAADALGRMRQARSIPEAIKQGVLLPEFRSDDPRVRAAIRGYEGAAQMQELRTGYLFPMLKTTLKRLPKETKDWLRRFVRQRVSPEMLKFEKLMTVDELRAKAPEFAVLFEQMSERMRSMRDDLISTGGYFNEGQVEHMKLADEAGLQWLHRSFLAYLLDGYEPDAGRFERAIQKTLDEATKRGRKVSADEVAQEILNLIDRGMLSSPSERANHWRTSRLNGEILERREQVPYWLRGLLGEVNDPSFAVASSMSELERLWGQMRVTKTFIETPGSQGVLWDSKPNARLFKEPIPNNKQFFGEFAGKYVAPELWEAVMHASAPQMRNKAMQAISAMASWWKTAKVGLSPVAQITNFVSNTTYAAASGLPLWHPTTYGRLRQAAQSILDFGRKPLLGEADARPAGLTKRTLGRLKSRDAMWMQWAIEDRVVRPAAGSDFAGSEARALAERFLKAKRTGVFGFYDVLHNAAIGARAKVGRLMDFADSSWRVAVYIEQVTQGMDRGLNLVTARARAANIVNENFASAATIGKGTRQVLNAAQGFFALNPFGAWHADNLRVTANWARNSTKWQAIRDGGFRSGEGSAQSLNVALQFGLLSAIGYGLARWYGITDQDEAVYASTVKPSFGENNPEPFRTMLSGRDSQGRLRAVTWKAFFPFETFLRGNPELGMNPDAPVLTRSYQASTNLLQRVFINMVMGFTQSSLSEDPSGRALQSVGLPIKLYRSPEALPGEEGVRAWLNAGLKAIEPSLLESARTVARRMQLVGNLKRNEEPLTPGQGLSQLTPFKVEPVGARSAESTRVTARRQEHELQAEQRYIPKLEHLTPEERGRLSTAQVEAHGQSVFERSKRERVLGTANKADRIQKIREALKQLSPEERERLRDSLKGVRHE